MNSITPFHFAAINGHMTVKYLIGELGCNPQIGNNNGSTPLHCACQKLNGHVEVTKYPLMNTNTVQNMAILHLCIQLLSIATCMTTCGEVS